MALAGLNILKFLAYLREELTIVLATASSDAVLPQIMRKLERLGVKDSVVGLVIPTGYSFNLDAFSIYLTLAVVFIAQATNTPLSFGDLLLVLGVSLITSKGAHGVPGSAIVILAATLNAVPSIPAIGLVLVLSVDWFIGMARALGNLIGNCVATVVVAAWEGDLDRAKARQRARWRGTGRRDGGLAAQDLRSKILDQPQQHARAGIGVGEFDMLVGMMADAAAAAHEHHADIGDVDHRHAVMPCPARQFEHAKTLRRNGFRHLALQPGAQGTVRFSWVTSICSASLRRLAIASIRRTISATASLRCAIGRRADIDGERDLPRDDIGRARHRVDVADGADQPAIGSVRQNSSISTMHSAAPASASRRSAIGTVPAWPAMPVRLAASRVAPAIAVTTPTGRI